MPQNPEVCLTIQGDYIQLDKLLKACSLCASGGEAHAAITAGCVTVDGQIETRKRAKLRPGQVVHFAGQAVRLQ